MITINDKKKCCGCTSCQNICPKKCIRMEADEEGFIYPTIEISQCIDCHACEKVCPILNPPEQSKSVKTFAARDIRADVVKNSTSGGIFTSIMEHVLKNNGVVYGVIVDSDNVVKHIRVDNLSDKRIRKIPCSKYVRSDITSIFSQVRNDLEQGRLVCFSGTPCQTAGLSNYVKNYRNSIILVDVVCRGNPSPTYWKLFANYLERKYQSRITDVKFRSKTYGYHSGSMRVDFENGKKYVASVRVNLFLKAFFEDLCSRPSCYACSFKTLKRCSDLTLFDCWHAEDLLGVKDDDKGYTNIIVQSEKGHELLLELKSTIELHEVDTEKAVHLDGIMVRNSVQWNEKRESFLKKIEDGIQIENYCCQYFTITVKDKMIEGMKKFVYFRK